MEKFVIGPSFIPFDEIPNLIISLKQKEIVEFLIDVIKYLQLERENLDILNKLFEGKAVEIRGKKYVIRNCVDGSYFLCEIRKDFRDKERIIPLNIKYLISKK